MVKMQKHENRSRLRLPSAFATLRSSATPEKLLSDWAISLARNAIYGNHSACMCPARSRPVSFWRTWGSFNPEDEKRNAVPNASSKRVAHFSFSTSRGDVTRASLDHGLGNH